jgi:hypothetical protein
LHEERSRLVEEQARLAKVEANHEHARQSIVEAKAAIDQLDAEERAAWERWAGTDVAEPKADEVRRRDLNRKLALAEGDARSAENATRGVAPRVREIVARLAEIDGELRALALEAIREKYAERAEAFGRTAAEMKTFLTDLRAMPEALRLIGVAAGERGDATFQRVLFTAVSQMHEQRLAADPEPNLGEIAAAAVDLRATFAQMGIS